MTPFISFVNELMTSFSFVDILSYKVILPFLAFLFGFWNIYQGMEILERCDYEYNRAVK